MSKKVLAVIIILVNLITVFIIGYFTVEPRIAIFIALTGLSVTVIAALLLKNIKLAIPLLIAPVPFSHLLRFNFGINTGGKSFTLYFLLVDILAIVAFTCFLLFRSTVKGKQIISGNKISVDYLNILLFILMGWIFVSALWAPSIIASVYCGILILSHFFIYLLFVALIKTEQDVYEMIKVWIIISIVVGGAMLISILPIESLKIQKDYIITNWLDLVITFVGDAMRAGGISDEKNTSQFTGIALLFSLVFLSNTNNKKDKVFLLCLLVFFGLSILFAQAKNTAIGLFLGILFIIIAVKRFRVYFIRNLFWYITIVTVLFGIFLVIQSAILSYRGIDKGELPTRFTSSNQTEDAIYSRIKLWNSCYKEMVRKNAYIYGLGIGGCGYYLADLTAANRKVLGNPHSFYLSIFFDIGIIGVFLFLLIVLMLIAKIFLLIKNLNEGIEKDMLLVILSCAIGIGLAGLTELSYYNYIYPWIIAGIGISIYKLVVSKQTAALKLDKI